MAASADTKRRASHAGTWYSESLSNLSVELDSWLATATVTRNPTVRAIIAPPSHHIYIEGCALSEFTKFQTPLGDLSIDTDIVAQLHATGHFQSLDMQADEDEHSIEMHLPYIHKIMSARQDPYTIVPILVGSSRPQNQHQYAELLAPYLADPSNLFVVSSDFCHWGRRFDYTFRGDPSMPIHESIEKVDREAMALIEKGDPAEFDAYLKRTRNTICGRSPIGILLHTLQCVKEAARERKGGIPTINTTTALRVDTKFTHYSQSSQVTDERESSVSYASACVQIYPSA
ncbi:AmmeMemoRadiSam system protein B [Batrachochytrium salamandrivorans]|nr:AmmeMemoRadiSam system protein B [Batrachochytrium salamandrivorans]